MKGSRPLDSSKIRLVSEYFDSTFKTRNRRGSLFLELALRGYDISSPKR